MSIELNGSRWLFDNHNHRTIDYGGFPGPGTPAMADILQALGSLTLYAVDTLLMERPEPGTTGGSACLIRALMAAQWFWRGVPVCCARTASHEALATSAARW